MTLHQTAPEEKEPIPFFDCSENKTRVEDETQGQISIFMGSGAAILSA